MPMMPAICETCNATFPSGFFFSNATEIYLEGNTAGPCPKCGGMGRIPDGLYDFVGNSIQLLTGPARTVEDLYHLAAILEQEKGAGSTPAEAAERIRREKPEFRGLSELLHRVKLGDLPSWITILILIITLIINNQASQNINISLELSDEQVEQATYQFYVPAQ